MIKSNNVFSFSKFCLRETPNCLLLSSRREVCMHLDEFQLLVVSAVALASRLSRGNARAIRSISLPCKLYRVCSIDSD
jgi:hypothetical protein